MTNKNIVILGSEIQATIKYYKQFVVFASTRIDQYANIPSFSASAIPDRYVTNGDPATSNEARKWKSRNNLAQSCPQKYFLDKLKFWNIVWKIHADTSKIN